MKVFGSTRRSRNTTTENLAASWTPTATASSCGNHCRKSCCPEHFGAPHGQTHLHCRRRHRQPHRRRHHPHGWLRLVRHPGEPHCRCPPQRRERPHHCQQQRRRRRFRHRRSAPAAPSQKDALHVRGREQALRAISPERGIRSGI